MSIAVIATLVSLFAVAWPGRDPRTTPRPGSPTVPAVAASLTGVSLQDPDGTPVALKDLAPAVILLVEGCTCQKLISTTADAVAGSASTAKILVVAVHAPTLPSGLNEKATVRALADPNNSVRATVPALADDRTSSAVLVAADGRVIKATRSVTSPDEFRAELSKL
ncbi:hypothetical protein ABT297_08825 [Dactylosporangium sp. NPDC000555]|uniref:hypothetical protein n=1 Tax=Dactylosporangium sp. NPDC000555 TaxID=3154260 RepID=UPI00332B1D96